MSRASNGLQGVSIITSTNRPHFFYNILKNYNNQRYPVKELIIILNKENVELAKYQKIAQKYKNVSVYKIPEKESLGRCLNFAVSKTKYPFITKFDDDDFYSPYYLSGQMKVLHQSNANIVGKRHILRISKQKSCSSFAFPNNKISSLV
ncbi:glycosyltransferase [Paenibacillus guangzhouensis]|uniref:glycosyltransferase n=1 Tax=Paenibacillus guangzhouensis TaxID=1473112 RepID=UPI001D0F8A8A|nr:glycosyltransferase [Paenibacillus guangzhouensis]